MSMYNVYRDKLPRSSHNIGKPRYFDMDMGILTPFYIRELYPGDSVKLSNSVFIETRTLKVPLKNRVRFRQYWFFVPYRLMWKNWEKFIFGGKTGDYTASFPYYLHRSGSSSADPYSGKKSLWSMLGFPQVKNLTGAQFHEFTDKLKVSAMPFAAYQMIYKDWFRDENLSSDVWDFENSGQAWLSDGGNVSIKNEDGTDLPIDLNIVRHCPWSRTYFTAALPFRQRGTANRVPLSGSAFLHSFVSQNGGETYTISPITYRTVEDSGETNRFIVPATSSQGQTINQSLQTGIAFPTFDDGSFTPGHTQRRALGIEGSDLQGFTITELRLLAKLQEFAEINARFGFRYIEGLRGHFGVSPTDARLDRPEFICGSSQDVIVAEVLQTSGTQEGGTPLATPAGRGVSASGGRLGSYFAEEHGILMAICSIMPEQIYTQGVPRMWTRRTKEEFFSPEFNGLSEQEIRTKELYATPDMTEEQLNSVLGFVPAWEELRHDTAFANGSLRDPDNEDIYAWTMARHFTSIPTLSENFVMGDQNNANGGIRTDAFATGNATPPFFVSINNKIRLLSTVSKSGTPGITRI